MPIIKNLNLKLSLKYRHQTLKLFFYSLTCSIIITSMAIYDISDIFNLILETREDIIYSVKCILLVI